MMMDHDIIVMILKISKKMKNQEDEGNNKKTSVYQYIPGHIGGAVFILGA